MVDETSASSWAPSSLEVFSGAETASKWAEEELSDESKATQEVAPEVVGVELQPEVAREEVVGAEERP